LIPQDGSKDTIALIVDAEDKIQFFGDCSLYSKSAATFKIACGGAAGKLFASGGIGSVEGSKGIFTFVFIDSNHLNLMRSDGQVVFYLKRKE